MRDKLLRMTRQNKFDQVEIFFELYLKHHRDLAGFFFIGASLLTVTSFDFLISSESCLMNFLLSFYNHGIDD
jgi:hypothetical protein